MTMLCTSDMVQPLGKGKRPGEEWKDSITFVTECQNLAWSTSLKYTRSTRFAKHLFMSLHVDCYHLVRSSVLALFDARCHCSHKRVKSKFSTNIPSFSKRYSPYSLILVDRFQFDVEVCILPCNPCNCLPLPTASHPSSRLHYRWTSCSGLRRRSFWSADINNSSPLSCSLLGRTYMIAREFRAPARCG